MRNGKVRHFLAAILLVAVGIAVVVGAQTLLERRTGLKLVDAMTKPIGDYLDRPPSKAKNDGTTEVSVPVVAMTPMTGGAAKPEKGVADPNAESASTVHPATPATAPVPSATSTVTTSGVQTQKVPPAPQVEATNSNAITLEPKVQDMAASGLTSPTSKANPDNASGPAAKALNEAGASPRATTDSAFSMQEGNAVVGGSQAPGLRIALNASQIEALLKAGKVVVIATDEKGTDAYYLGSPDGGFRPIADLDASTISERYLPIEDAGLVAAWSIRLGALPGHQFDFGLRFTSGFDRAILKQQFAKLAVQHIDFQKALADKQRVVTDGHLGKDLGFVVDHVKVE